MRRLCGLKSSISNGNEGADFLLLRVRQRRGDTRMKSECLNPLRIAIVLDGVRSRCRRNTTKAKDSQRQKPFLRTPLKVNVECRRELWDVTDGLPFSDNSCAFRLVSPITEADVDVFTSRLTLYPYFCSQGCRDQVPSQYCRAISRTHGIPYSNNSSLAESSTTFDEELRL